MASRAAVLLVVIALAACGGSSSSDKPGDTELAGKVVELTGAASIERDGETIAVAMGTEVMGSDTVVTGAESSVVIQLFHNNARWQLGADKRRVVKTSAAWNAAESDSEGFLDKSDQDKTAAAGRQGERSAGDTAATARRPAELAPESPAAEVEEPESAVTERAPEPSKQTRGVAPSASKRPPPQPKPDPDPAPAPVPEPAPPPPAPSGGGGGGATLGGEGGKEGGGGAGAEVDSLDGIGTTGKTERKRRTRSTSKPRVSMSVAISGGLDKAEVTTALARGKSGAVRCYEKALDADPSLEGTLVVRIAVAADGSTTASITGGTLSKQVGPCVKARARSLTLPATSDGKSAVVTVTLAFDK